MTTDVTPAPRREATPAKPAPDRTRTVIVVVLALGWLAGVLWRLWLGSPVTHPIAHTDEDSYMNAARAIAGGPEGFSSETPLFRRVGYPLLVSPAFLFGLDFATSYKIVHVLNAMISALTLPLAYLLGRRMFGMRVSIALAAAFAAATIPAGVFWSLVGMTDSIMAPLMLGWFLAIHRWLGDTARKGAAITAGLVTGVLYTVHIRGTILLVVYLAFLAFLVFRRLAAVRVAALSLVPVMALVVLNQVVILLVGDRVHLRGDIVGGGTLAVFTESQRLQVFIAAVGTNIWYLCVVTAGLAGLAWVAATLAILRPAEPTFCPPGWRDAAFRWTAGVALLSTIGTALGAALILAGLVGLPADAIYSRYVQVFVPFWLLFGFAVLADSRLRSLLRYAIVPVLVLGAGGAIIAFRLRYVASQGHRLGYGLFGGPDIITITAGWKQFRPLVGTAIGLTGLAVLLAATRVRRLMIPVLAVVVALNGVTMAVMRDRLIEPIAARYTLPIDLPKLGVGPGDSVAFTDDMTHEGYFVLYHDVYWTELTQLADDTKPDVDVVIGRYYPGVPFHWDGTRYGYELLDSSQADGQVGIWRRR
jgi:4-amino-4-deoxy-L-arabinose transferase-like glycosyltransferase